MKVGDWVFFETRNWPKDVHTTHIDLAIGRTGPGALILQFNVPWQRAVTNSIFTRWEMQTGL